MQVTTSNRGRSSPQRLPFAARYQAQSLRLRTAEMLAWLTLRSSCGGEGEGAAEDEAAGSSTSQDYHRFMGKSDS